MGTRADFYVGRGEKAEWLGSIGWDGYPDGIEAPVLAAKDEATYRKEVTAFLAAREDKTLPEHGWPWPWETSSTTDFAYAFDTVGVYASNFGGNWFVCRTPEAQPPEDDNGGNKAIFPDMSKSKQREKFGKHSGIMVIGS